ncbi:Uncharacterised protein [Salmonella enterica subsp. enterica serovar Typhi]|nr:Uncharacterised protein [Salmonella enterica subsp. enterica serovar Typhi]
MIPPGIKTLVYYQIWVIQRDDIQLVFAEFRFPDGIKPILRLRHRITERMKLFWVKAGDFGKFASRSFTPQHAFFLQVERITVFFNLHVPIQIVLVENVTVQAVFIAPGQ